MKCHYCSTYQQSTIRPDNNGTRFCIPQRKMVENDDKICENYQMAETFWCDNTNCWVNFPMCVARQNKEHPDCNHCRQKKDVWDAKRFAGRHKPKIIQEEPKKILIRR